jgi:hypothetical protein
MPPDTALHPNTTGLDADHGPPGVTTIITAALAPMLIVQQHPVLLDTSDWVPRFQT